MIFSRPILLALMYESDRFDYVVRFDYDSMRQQTQLEISVNGILDTKMFRDEGGNFLDLVDRECVGSEEGEVKVLSCVEFDKPFFQGRGSFRMQ